MILKRLANIIFLLFSLASIGQVVYTEPGFPIVDQQVDIFFNAAEGSGGLKDYTGDVYAHTGVITDKSTGGSDWKYTKAAWTVNIPECKLTRIQANLYKLTISPDIRSFYGVPSSERILKMAFVFRSADRTREGKDASGGDIFVDISSGEFDVTFTNPDKEISAIDKGGIISFNVSSSKSSVLKLFINGSNVFGANGFNLSYPYQFNNAGFYTVVAEAKLDNEIRRDTTNVLVRDDATEESLPEGVQDGINYHSATSLTLVLHAPGKKHVYAIGDFNNWIPDNSYQLKKDGDKWWITLDNLTPGVEYAYQYLIDDGMLIADPYTEKILDPWNDKFIPQTVYPDLKAYPSGKTSGIVSVLQPGKENYVWKHTDYTKPEVADLVIYELLVRDFIESHDIKDVQKKLGYLKSLGVNAIELMPFNEFEGNSSWGYNPSFFFAPDKYYGTEYDFKTFIDACHEYGMLVILDIVLNHAYGQNSLVQMYFENGNPSVDNPWFNVTSPNTLFSWGYDFDHESDDTKYFVDRVTDFWLNEYNLDGFRFDFTKGFTNKPGDGQAYDASRVAILKRIYDKMQEQKPGSLMILEHLADNSEEKVLADYGMLLWGNINHGYAELAMGWVPTSDISWGSYKKRGWSKPHLISYMESHDEERLMHKVKTFGNASGSYSTKTLSNALDRMEMAAALYFTIPGPKMIWQFGEYGYDYYIDFNGRTGEKPIVWHYLDNPDRYALKEVYSKLIQLKTQNPIFKTTDFTLDVGAKAVKTVALSDEETHVMAFGNTGVISTTSNIGFQTTGWWYELLTGDSVNVSATPFNMELAPGQYHVYSTKKLKSTSLEQAKPSNNTLRIYPNPAKSMVTIDSNRMINRIMVYNVGGKLIESGTSNSFSYKLEVSGYDPGIYFVKVLSNTGSSMSKFLVTH